MISMQHIYLKREERQILEDVNLEFRDQEHWVILGRNGSGKTTLLEMMTGYMFPSSGTVDVLGERYGACDIRELRKKIGYISQSLMEKLTLRDPVWEVVATGAFAFLRFYQEIPADVEARARELLQSMKLGHVADNPLGTLSQGERKKIMLARALMGDPEVLILDEPCAGLDLYEREQFLEQIEVLKNKKMTLVYVTHHLEEIVPLFTHVALIHEGKVIAAGEKMDVLTPDLLQLAYQVPINITWAEGRPWIRVQAGG